MDEYHRDHNIALAWSCHTYVDDKVSFSYLTNIFDFYICPGLGAIITYVDVDNIYSFGDGRSSGSDCCNDDCMMMVIHSEIQCNTV